jgi:hypothetical protein
MRYWNMLSTTGQDLVGVVIITIACIVVYCIR